MDRCKRSLSKSFLLSPSHPSSRCLTYSQECRRGRIRTYALFRDLLYRQAQSSSLPPAGAQKHTATIYGAIHFQLHRDTYRSRCNNSAIFVRLYFVRYESINPPTSFNRRLIGSFAVAQRRDNELLFRSECTTKHTAPRPNKLGAVGCFLLISNRYS